MPQLEAKGNKVFWQRHGKDVFEILKDHGFNCIRLYAIVDPYNDGGYSPGKDFCNLPHTLAVRDAAIFAFESV